MKITVRAFADYREIIGNEVELTLPEGETIGTLLFDIAERHPELQRQMFVKTGELKEFINILINGRNIAFLDNMATIMVDGDIIALFPPVAGG
jgi:molybdopterin synthase sulfur carrier subunit